MENVLRLNSVAIEVAASDVWVAAPKAVMFFPRYTLHNKMVYSMSDLQDAVETGTVRTKPGRYLRYNLWDCIKQCNIK